MDVETFRMVIHLFYKNTILISLTYTGRSIKKKSAPYFTGWNVWYQTEILAIGTYIFLVAVQS